MKILAGNNTSPRMALLSYELDSEFVDLAEASQKELLDVIKKENNGDDLWGYYPGHPDQELVSKYRLKNCESLHHYMETKFAPKHAELTDTHLAFIRLCIGAHYSEGLHLDADDQTAVLGDDKRSGRDVFKFLMNLHPTAEREFRYLDTALEELEGLGIKLSRDQYSKVDYSKISSLPIKTVLIPPRQGNKVHSIAFLANTTPHSGNDREDGHFLLSFAGYRNSLLQ
jgi:hypothetical protein